MKKSYLKNAVIALFAVTLLSGFLFSCSSDDDEPKVTVNKTELTTIINESSALLNLPDLETDFPTNAINEFKRVVEAAKAIASNEDATQAQVDAMVVQVERAKEVFLASELGLIPESALLMEMTFDEEVTNNKFKTGGKGWTAELRQGEAEIFGTATNYPSFENGKVGKSAYFSNGSHIRIDDYSANDLLGGKISIATWVMPDSTRPGNYIISYNYWNSWKFQLQEQNKPFFTIHTNEDGWVDADNQMDFSAPNGEWTHLVVTLDLTANKLIFYVNGEMTMEWDETGKPGLIGTGAFQYDKVLPLLIGACTTYAEADAEWSWEWSRTPDGWDGFVGHMDELKLYNITLEPGQVTKLYESEK